MSKKLLLADDSVTIQRVIELTFSGEDVHVLAVGDGEEAIARIPSEKPDIVLADIGMPKRSGYEVSAFVKGHPDFSHIPVLLLAGAFEPVDEVKAQESKCDGVLVKPFEPQHVVARVRELVRGAKKNTSEPAIEEIERPSAQVTPFRRVEPTREDSRPVPESFMDAMDADLEPRIDLSLPETADLEIGGSLDDYFDKLDEAFSSISGAPLSRRSDTVGSGGRGPVDTAVNGGSSDLHIQTLDAPASLDASAALGIHGLDTRVLLGGAAGADPSHEAVGLPTLDELLSSMTPMTSPPVSFDSSPIPASDTTLPASHQVEAQFAAVPQSIDLPQITTTIEAAPGGETTLPAERPDTLDEAPAAAPGDRGPGRSLIADAFSAFLAVEQGEPGAVPLRLARHGEVPVITDAMVDDIARRVTERLALGLSGHMSEIVRQVVSDVAERLVREEISRIRSQS